MRIERISFVCPNILSEDEAEQLEEAVNDGIFDESDYDIDTNYIIITVSTGVWDLEFDVPEELYNKKSIDLKLKSPIKGFKIKKLQLTSTGLKLEAEDKKLEKEVIDTIEIEDGMQYYVTYESSSSVSNTLQGGITSYSSDDEYKELVYITDENGTIYISRTTGPGLNFLFDVTEDIWRNKKLYLNVKQNGELYTTELIEK